LRIEKAQDGKAGWTAEGALGKHILAYGGGGDNNCDTELPLQLMHLVGVRVCMCA